MGNGGRSITSPKWSLAMIDNNEEPQRLFRIVGIRDDGTVGTIQGGLSGRGITDWFIQHCDEIESRNCQIERDYESAPPASSPSLECQPANQP